MFQKPRLIASLKDKSVLLHSSKLGSVSLSYPCRWSFASPVFCHIFDIISEKRVFVFFVKSSVEWMEMEQNHVGGFVLGWRRDIAKLAWAKDRIQHNETAKQFHHHPLKSVGSTRSVWQYFKEREGGRKKGMIRLRPWEICDARGKREETLDTLLGSHRFVPASPPIPHRMTSCRQAQESPPSFSA